VPNPAEAGLNAHPAPPIATRRFGSPPSGTEDCPAVNRGKAAQNPTAPQGCRNVETGNTVVSKGAIACEAIADLHGKYREYRQL
jgi:hypothetical protein